MSPARQLRRLRPSHPFRRAQGGWNDGKRQLDVAYRSGGDLMEAGFTTDFGQPTAEAFRESIPAPRSAPSLSPAERRLALPAGRAGARHELAQQGTTGRLEKNGAVLTTEPGRKAYLLADPLAGPGRGAVVGYNPLPDPQFFALSTRDGMSLRADGKVRPAAGRIPAVGKGLRHQPRAEGRAGRLRHGEIIHDLGLAEPPR